ncbi:hypothetical protein FRC08_014483 [Ceratobasidium sp. 394]|nr:hypothetical protein FRC08_014483 [Ceratobasidium sp. 394]
MTSSAMDIDAVSEGPQPDTQSLGEPLFPEKSQVDPVGFNQRILRAIEERKAENPRDFKSQTRLVFDEYFILLRIVIKTWLGSCDMDNAACKDHLLEHPALSGKLENAYASHSFAGLLEDLQLPPEIVEAARTSTQGISPSNGDNSLQAAFEEPYLGNTAKVFINTLNRERQYYPPEAAEHPYNWSIPVIQSSGMGKSRMVDEAAKTVFTVPIDLGADLPPGKKARLPPDVEMRRYFEVRKDQSDEEQQAEYATLLRVLFDETCKLVERCWPKLTGEALARACADYFKEGRTERKVGANREQFFSVVVNEATKRRRGLDKGKTLSRLDRSLQSSCRKLTDIVHPNRPTGTNACFVYFDEAQALVQPVQAPNEKHPLHNLGVVLSGVADQEVFFIFLLTDSRVKGFAPPPFYHPSLLEFEGSQTIPPFTELPFDLYEETVLNNVDSLTLENMCQTGAMVGFGRALWFVQYKSDPTGDIFRFAMDKLCASGADDRKEDSALAALSVRIGVTFDRAHPDSNLIESRLVKSHLRMVYAIPRHQEYMHTGASSEPVLAEAAGLYLGESGRGGVAKVGPNVLASACGKGIIVHGERGELCGRLLLTAAHDIALRKIPRPDVDQPYYHRPIPVLDFLRALFHPAHHARILGATPATAVDELATLSQAFSGSFVSFSHFALAEDVEMLSTFGLTTALVHGMALLADDCQCSIDAVIPIHMGPITTPISPETTSVINLQFRNRKKAHDCYVDRRITVPDVTKPVISIIFEFGMEGQGSNAVEMGENDCHHEGQERGED